MSARRLAVVGVVGLGLAGASCGDNLHREDATLTTAVSGTRLVLQKYRYDDGTEQIATTELYDTGLHVHCVSGPWIDGTVRCVPVVPSAVYVDAACTSLVGIAQGDAVPSYFLASDAAPMRSIASRLFRAGPPTTAITQAFFRSVDGACTGPDAIPPGFTLFFEVAAELGGGDLVEIHEDEIGDGQLGLRIQRSDDGMRLLSGLRDRQLDLGCLPQVQSDGSVVCVPFGATAASFFGDPSCHEAVAAITAAPTPTVAMLVEPTGCISYHSVGRAVSPPIYRRDGDACTPVTAPADSALFAVAGPIELPAMGRSLEGAVGHRLQHIVLDHAELRLFDAPLFDAATGVDCAPRAIRGVIRCLPTNITPALVLFGDDCTTPVPVVEVPQRTCERFEFASTSRPFQLRSIAGPVSGKLFRPVEGACEPYTPANGMALHAVGAAVDPTMFLGGVYFSERSL